MNPNLTKEQIAEAFQRTLAGGVPRVLGQESPRRREIFDSMYLLPDMEEQARQGYPVYYARALTKSELEALERAVDGAAKIASPGGLPGWDCLHVRGDKSVNRQKLRGNLEGVRYRWRTGAPGAPGYFEVEYEVKVTGWRDAQKPIQPTTAAA
jgi:hypothetical protein